MMMIKLPMGHRTSAVNMARIGLMMPTTSRRMKMSGSGIHLRQQWTCLPLAMSQS